MEELFSLSEGEQFVREWGAREFFNGFFDSAPFDATEPPPNSAMTPEEHAAIGIVLRLMNEACTTTPRMVDDDELIETGWPARIAPAAADALTVFLKRGRFSEEKEEDVPSNPIPWLPVGEKSN